MRIHVLAQAAGHPSATLRDALSAAVHDGLLGRYAFDENGGVIDLRPAVKQVVDGQAVSYR